MSTRKEIQEKDGLDFTSVLESDDHEGASAEGALVPIDIDSDTEAEIIARLKECAASFTERKYAFKPGDIVRWKKNMKNKRYPQNGAPVIVVGVMEPPVYDNKADPGSSYFKEPLTITAGHVDKDEEFTVFHYDGRRFEPYAI